MLTREDDIDAHALRKRGWTITAIANHLGRDRKTIRGYLRGDRTPGQRARSAVDPFEAFVAYCTARLAEDPHLWASALMDELVELGFTGSYPTLTRQLRVRGLRPACEPCRPTTGRPVAVIEHPAGEETQWDWVELPDPPPAWGWGKHAHLLVGALAHSGRWRGVLTESEDQPHLIEAMDRIVRALGGVSLTWRFDRMATVCHPGSGKVSASFAAVAKHYGASVAICPPRRGNRTGVVEKANHTAGSSNGRSSIQAPPDHQYMIRRSIDDGELAFYHCYNPRHESVGELVRVAGARWPIEECFQTGMGQVALDNYQVRLYPA